MLRGLIDARLAREPDAKLIVLGDFNDARIPPPSGRSSGAASGSCLTRAPPSATATRARGEPPYYEPRDVAWTYFYGKDDTYSRIDYILLSPALKRNWLANETYIPFIPNWGIGSDHRPVVAGFSVEGR